MTSGALKVLGQVRDKGWRRSLALGQSVARAQARRHLRLDRRRQYVFVSQPIDPSGAPLVLLQIVREYLGRYGERVRLVTPSYTETMAPQLAELSIRVEKGALMGPRLSGAQLALDRDDFVLLNACTVHRGYAEHVLEALESGRLVQAHWFLHEDVEQVRTWGPWLLEPAVARRISRLVDRGGLRLMLPSANIGRRYREAFAVRDVDVIRYRVDVPHRYLRARAAGAFHRLDFLLVGPSFQGLKGHQLALRAFERFMQTADHGDPTRYREFALCLVGLGDDELSQQIKEMGTRILGSRLHVYPPLPKERLLEITATCNTVISCSRSETFGLAVAEAMLMRHVVLRNDTGGVDEQLRDGENGYFIGHEDVAQFAEALERVLSRNANSDADLQRMGETSHEMIVAYTSSSYIEQIESLGVPERSATIA